MEIPVITKRLKAPLPTILAGPRTPAGFPKSFNDSMTLNKISGADDPRANKVRLAIVAFQTGTSIVYLFP